MDLQQAADEAMNYLDSVGVAAEWDALTVYGHVDTIRIHIGRTTYYLYKRNHYQMSNIKRYYPQKSPA